MIVYGVVAVNVEVVDLGNGPLQVDIIRVILIGQPGRSCGLQVLRAVREALHPAGRDAGIKVDLVADVADPQQAIRKRSAAALEERAHVDLVLDIVFRLSGPVQHPVRPGHVDRRVGAAAGYEQVAVRRHREQAVAGRDRGLLARGRAGILQPGIRAHDLEHRRVGILQRDGDVGVPGIVFRGLCQVPASGDHRLRQALDDRAAVFLRVSHNDLVAGDRRAGHGDAVGRRIRAPAGGINKVIGAAARGFLDEGIPVEGRGDRRLPFFTRSGRDGHVQRFRNIADMAPVAADRAQPGAAVLDRRGAAGGPPGPLAGCRLAAGAGQVVSRQCVLDLYVACGVGAGTVHALHPVVHSVGDGLAAALFQQDLVAGLRFQGADRFAVRGRGNIHRSDLRGDGGRAAGGHHDLVGVPGAGILNSRLDGSRADCGTDGDVSACLAVNGLDLRFQRGRIRAGHGDVGAVDQDVPLVVSALSVYIDRDHGVRVSLQGQRIADGLRVRGLAGVAQGSVNRYCDHIGILDHNFHFFVQIRCHISLPPA